MQKRILITGASGMLGATLVKRFQDRYDVYATATQSKALEFFKNYRSFDLKSESYNDLMAWSQPDVVIHCAALTNGNYCETNPSEAFLINSIALKKIVDSAPEQTHVIYISTDAVFHEDTHLATETDCPKPQNVYGKSKEIGEFFLQNSTANFTIIRTTIVGLNLNTERQGFVEWIINSAKTNTDISLFDDVLFTPISIWDLSDQIDSVINSTDFSKRIVHIAGGDACTKYDFGIALLQSLELPTTHVKRGKITTFEDRAKRSTDQTLSSTYFENVLGEKMPTMKQTVESIKINYHND